MSTSGREAVLARIRGALGDRHRTQAEQAELEQRLKMSPAGPTPPLDADRLGQFIAKARANLFTMERVASLQMLVPAIRMLLSGTSGVPDISVAPALAYLGWPTEWKINFGAGRFTEPLSVTLAVAGVAETGSVVLRSDAGNPTTLNFLPDTHVIALRTSEIVGRLEDVWQRVGTCVRDWPRTVNIISGPSRTADVGGVVVRPAHGPKNVHLILVDD